jgi:hypothetical protein
MTKEGALTALKSAAGADHALNTREVAPPRAHGASRCAHHRLDRFRLSRTYFKYHFTIAGKPSRKSSDDLAIET